MTRAVLTVTVALLAAACSRGNAGKAAGDGSAAASPLGDGSPAASGSAASAPPGDGRAHITSGTAQAIGMKIAAERWPQHHIRLASAVHNPGFWKVVFEFDDGTGGHVILDRYGELLDGGTSAGDHL